MGGTLTFLLRSHSRFSAQTYQQYGAESSPSSPFVEPVLPITDVDWHSLEGSAVFFLLTHGIIQGYPDGTFRGAELVSRAEVAKMLILAGSIPITQIENNNRFHDVAEGEWYTPFVMTAAKNAIVEGFPTQRFLFKPSLSINTAEFLKMLTRTFNLREGMSQSYADVPQKIWYERFTGAAWQYELFPDRAPTLLQPGRLLTRREVAIAINLLFHQPLRRRLPQWLPPTIPVLPLTPLPLPPIISSSSPFLTSSSTGGQSGTTGQTGATGTQGTTGPFGGPTGGTMGGPTTVDTTDGQVKLAVSASWTCGNTLVDSRDGKSYGTVLVGTQCWMAANMNIGTMISGTLTQGTDCPSAAAIEKYCYSDNADNCTTYGGLYQWNQAMCGYTTEGATGICPTSWHIPTDLEYYTLEKYLKDGGQTCKATRDWWDCATAGTKLKSGGSSGFNGLLAGYREPGGTFASQGMGDYFWPSKEAAADAWHRALFSGYATVHRYAYSKTHGFSIRCLKN
ncbi:S-layer homology domain-containing protein [Candidatus Peregrinibacteria bacterium]|nr:S-layer homology domain-containing protein [Candidatus Peregrinibacteria bacterium]